MEAEWWILFFYGLSYCICIILIGLRLSCFWQWLIAFVDTLPESACKKYFSADAKWSCRDKGLEDREKASRKDFDFHDAWYFIIYGGFWVR